MHKCLKIVMIFFLLLPVSVVSLNNHVEGRSLFPDVNSFRDEIVYLTNKGIIHGYKNGNFGPNDPIKRIQAVQMILRELGVQIDNAKDPHYKDVPPGSYGYDEIAKATELGIISGKGNGIFDPGGRLTRGQMAIILVNAYNLKGNYITSFKDVSPKAKTSPYIKTLAAHHITAGYPDGTFRPGEVLNRGQFAAFMARLLNEDFKPYDSVNTPVYDSEEMVNHEQSVVMIELYDANNEFVSQGSGFITVNQLIATNFHVISGGVKAVAITENGDQIPLDGVVAYDGNQDIALLKPAEKVGYPSLPLLDFNDVKNGEKVVAIGSPYGLQNSISEGIVSGKRTFEDGTSSLKAIQTTANITFGSSGGPLLNMRGFVIGLNTFSLEGINFAISVDYVTGLIDNYKAIDFNKIKTKPFSEMPLLEMDEEEDWNEGVDEGESPEPSNAGTLQGVKQTFSDLFIDAVHDTNLPVIYGINENGELISVNYETKNVKRLPFSHPAERIFYANGELYVTLLKGEHSSYWWEETQEGAVAIVDPATLKMKKLFDIKVDPYDIVADDHYFYVSSGSGQWTNLISFDKETGTQVSLQMIRQQSELIMHPNEDRIYAIDSDSSPRDMEVFSIENGVISAGYDSPYHGDYDMAPYMSITPDGKYLFNNIGTVFKATPLKTTNMQFLTDLKTSFNDVTFNHELTQFYLAIGNRVVVYDYENFTPVKTYKLSGNGYFLFYHNGHLVVLGEEIAPNTGIPKTFILKANE